MLIAPCFASNTATLTINGNASARLTIVSNQKNGLFCDDGYLIGYVAGFDIKYIELPWMNHDIDFTGLGSFFQVIWRFVGGWSQAELYDLNTNGMRIFIFPDGLVSSSEELFEVYQCLVLLSSSSDCSLIFWWTYWCTCSRVDRWRQSKIPWRSHGCQNARQNHSTVWPCFTPFFQRCATNSLCPQLCSWPSLIQLEWTSHNHKSSPVTFSVSCD